MGVDAVIMFRSKEPLSERDVRVMNGDLCAAFGSHDLGIKPIRDYHAEHAPPGHFYEVDNSWRYYGKGYERGPWWSISAVLLWILDRGHEPRYGGDCDDFPPAITESEIRDLTRHFNTCGEDPYRIRGDEPTCPTCERRMPLLSSGPHNRREYVCAGCGANVVFDGARP